MGDVGEREALAVCSDKNMGSGISIWDLKTGDFLLHIPTCASPPHGFVCLRNKFLVASQTRKEGSVGGGSIFIWPLNKPQSPLRCYPLEAIGPLASTKDGVYLAGGALSGNIYLWEAVSGKLLKIWSGHRKAVKCILFSGDDSNLITGSEDGKICIWSMIRLLDEEDPRSSQTLLYCLLEHKSSITGLLALSCYSASIIISSSLDGSLKVWDLVSWKITGVQTHLVGITAIVVNPTEQVLFYGGLNGQIFASRLAFGLDNCISVGEKQFLPPEGHKGAITALAFAQINLISAYEDGSVCIWDIENKTMKQKFNHKKGRITNLIVLPWPSLTSITNRKRVSNCFSMCSLDKYPQPTDSYKSSIPLLPASLNSIAVNQNSVGFTSIDTLNQQIFDLKTNGTPEAMEMKVATSLESRIWASKMTKQVMEMNKHLQSRLLDMMQIRLHGPDEISSSAKKQKEERDPMTNPKSTGETAEP